MQPRLVGVVAGLASLGCGAVASAEVVNYAIDPTRSALTISGNLTSNPASPQTAGSTTTSFAGTIVADRQPTSIGFPGGSSMDAALQPVNQQPRADATPGSAPADYGRTAAGPFGSTAFEAIRGLFLDVEDDTGGFGIPLSGNTFASNDLVLAISSCDSDVIYGTSGVETSLSNKATSNGSGGGPSSVVVAGSTETLTLKFSTGAIGYSIFQSGDTTLIFNGTIVATRSIPEPALGAAAGMIAAGFIARRRRRAQRVI